MFKHSIKSSWERIWILWILRMAGN